MRTFISSRTPPPRVASLAVGLSAIAFGYILFRPVSHNLILYSVFCGLGLLAFLTILLLRPTLTREFVAISIVVGLLGVYGTIIGLANPGLVFTVLVFFVAPVLYFLCAAAATERAIFWFFRAAAASTIAIGVIILLFVWGEAGRIPQLVPEWLEQATGLGATFRGDASQARFYGLSSLTALGPMWAASLLIRRDALLPSWGLRFASAIAASGAALVSSRDAVVLVIVVAPVLGFLVHAVLRPRPFRRRFTLSPLVVSGLWFGAGIASIGAIFLAPRVAALGPVARAFESVQSFITGDSATASGDQSIRSLQAWKLLRAWQENPVFGAGFSARVPDYGRTSERPWVLELQYHLFLFNVGLVGVLFVAVLAWLAIVMLRRAASRAPALLPSLTVATVAGASMLIANATNPYLQAPGHVWALFLPLALANLMINRVTPDASASLGGAPERSKNPGGQSVSLQRSHAGVEPARGSDVE
jgi:hypothetical protein